MIEQIGIHKEMKIAFNIGLITLLDYVILVACLCFFLSFLSFQLFINIREYANEMISYWTTE